MKYHLNPIHKPNPKDSLKYEPEMHEKRHHDPCQRCNEGKFTNYDAFEQILKNCIAQFQTTL
ncbi:hypothetical protein, partial [Muribaculum sp.]|uniref:hypothetical protein n=1 Tax=Muribaculum sp. TaxID=1918611 RepID=UPI0023C83466